MKLKSIDRVCGLSKKDFLEQYFKPQKPVIIEDAIIDWPAYKRWSFDYMRDVAGDKIVPLYDDRPVDHKDGFNEPHATMNMAEYIDLLQREPTKYRIFLWNLFKEVPALQNDFKNLDLGLSILKGLPMLFFGGQKSYTFMHYDIDLANIFHIHFQGEKRVVLFDQKQTEFMYKVPHSLIVREDIDFANPDYEKWPGLCHVHGFEGTLKHGDVLYMPEGYWHYMQYISAGFSMSLRAMPRKTGHLAKALYNIFIMRYYDQLMRRLKGQAWIDYKNEQAIVRTKKNIVRFQASAKAS
ncbi:MAG TPA: cupin [Flavobacteriaceae bacterium]|jgi:ribosomal protein L16 Arg81 hydroxylase|nr:cupin [Flavobacteriaceae bacterium]